MRINQCCFIARILFYFYFISVLCHLDLWTRTAAGVWTTDGLYVNKHISYETSELLKVQVCRFGYRFQRIGRGLWPAAHVQFDANPSGLETVQSVHYARPFAVIRTGVHVEHFVQIERGVRRAIRLARSKQAKTTQIYKYARDCLPFLVYIGIALKCTVEGDAVVAGRSSIDLGVGRFSEKYY